jgi:hypothetical protein
MIALFRAGALVAVGLILGALLASPFVPYAGIYSGYDVPHEDSKAWADNGQDYSLLSPDAAGHPDQKLWSCDNTFNGESAVARGFDNDGVVATISDGPGDARCSGDDKNRNMGGHDECIGRYSSGVLAGCGPNSNHGT